ncbi:MAG: hypothetical protein DWI21_04250 [Planctomycetota bacterium]|nr:MAG: hypothetical protein DWI21_04250 [Planctomycetota bacterium]GDY08671.1 hypothetical protein LBMAG52_21570 [Planctomycetia bacterium]
MPPNLRPDPVTAIFGGCVLLAGVLLQLIHRAAWLREQIDFASDPRELRHFESRYRRRRQTSALIVLVGMLIPVVDLPVVWNLGPRASTIMWCMIGCLCIWIGVLAMGDLATTRAHSRVTLARLEVHKIELMEQLERLRPKPESSSEPTTDHQ